LSLIFRERPEFFPFGLMQLLAIGSCIAIFISASRIYDNFVLTMGFTIENSYQICEQPLNNRCVTHYVVKELDGASGDFVPMGNQFRQGVLESDPQIIKKSDSFTYEVNGTDEQWPYLWQQVFVLLSGIAGVILWLVFKGPKILLSGD